MKYDAALSSKLPFPTSSELQIAEILFLCESWTKILFLDFIQMVLNSNHL